MFCGPFRVGGTSVALSGGVALGYSIDPLPGSDGAIFVKMNHYRVNLRSDDRVNKQPLD
jgi:hypothetical protein